MILSVTLLIADYRYHQFTNIRKYFSLGAYPFYWVVDLPGRLWGSVQKYSKTTQSLHRENEHLRLQQTIQSAHMQRWMSVEAENVRLRSLLQASIRPQERFLVADIIQASADPSIHRMMLDKGSRNGIMLGQPVMDANGMIGEVIEVHNTMSKIILLTDPSYGIAVEGVRTGIRGIACGTGSMRNLQLHYITTNTVDLKVGDILVTSGLDGRYPPGYLVGIINSIQQDPGSAFSNIQVTPSANVERGRQVLVLQQLKRDS